MIKSYFKTALRNLLRNKGYSFINISGLALGMAVSILIGLWIPLAWYAMNTWLEKYEYRTTVSWWIFAISGFGAVDDHLAYRKFPGDQGSVIKSRDQPSLRMSFDCRRKS